MITDSGLLFLGHPTGSRCHRHLPADSHMLQVRLNVQNSPVDHRMKWERRLSSGNQISRTEWWWTEYNRRLHQSHAFSHCWRKLRAIQLPLHEEPTAGTLQNHHGCLSKSDCCKTHM